MKINRDVRKLADTALGKHPADLVVKDGTLMDVYTGRMLPGRSVAMVDEWIAYDGAGRRAYRRSKYQDH